ncbi:Alpha/Beta hydrolase protein [Mycena floridula]|nr:Alpha/Beta hydrolase protein [Mycena floridula]
MHYNDYRPQPWRLLYLVYQLLTTTFIRLPLWTLLAIPRSLRPRRSWSVTRTVLNALGRHFNSVTTRTGPLVAFPNHLALVKGFDGCWVEPLASKFIVGDLELFASVAQVESVRIPGYWIARDKKKVDVGNPPKPGEKVLYHFHGGGYVQLSACPSDPTSQIVKGLMKHIPNIHRTFSLEYRLSASSPYPATNPFPAALIDAMAGYIHLVKVVGYSPDDIIIEGDSAGGNLALALTRYLVENQDRLKIAPASALILFSPWTDLSDAPTSPMASANANKKSDYIGNTTDGSIDYSKESFTGPYGLGAAQVNRYISPASLHPQMNISFKGFPRTFIVAGEAEVLLDQIRVLKDKMMDELGEGNGVNEDDGKVIYYEAADAIHDYVVFRGFEPQRTDTLKAIATWFSAK